MKALLDILGRVLVWQGRVILGEGRMVFTGDAVTPLSDAQSIRTYDRFSDDLLQMLRTAGINVKDTSFGFTGWKAIFPERLFGSPIRFDGYPARSDNRDVIVGYFRLDDTTRMFAVFGINMALLVAIASMMTIALSVLVGDHTIGFAERPLEILLIPVGCALFLVVIRAWVELMMWFSSRQRLFIAAAVQSVLGELDVENDTLRRHL